MKKLLFSLGVFTLIVLLSSFCLSSYKQLNTVETSVPIIPNFKHENIFSEVAPLNSSAMDTVKVKIENVDFYEINITVKLPSGEDAGFFQNSISSKYTADKGIWEKWTTSTSGAHNHTKVLEKLEKVLRKY